MSENQFYIKSPKFQEHFQTIKPELELNELKTETQNEIKMKLLMKLLFWNINNHNKRYVFRLL